MDKEAIYQELEKGFLSTFMGELIPGMLHNFANPLSGIMGRSELLQRRLEDSIKKMEARWPGFSRDFGAEKIIKDIGTISGESDRFFHLFRDLSDKFSSLACQEPTAIDLSRLIESEMRFADFYLDIKHDYQKNIQLDQNLPAIVGKAADFSLSIFSLLMSAKERMKNSPVKEIMISTSHDAKSILLVMQDSGDAISDNCNRLAAERADESDFGALPQTERSICSALFLLRHYGVQAQFGRGNGYNRISLSIPY